MTETAGVPRFVTLLMGAVSNCSLYSREHPAVAELSQKAFEVLAECLAAAPSVEVMVVDSDIILNKTPFRDLGIHGAGLVKRLRRKGLARVDFLPGVTEPELRGFVGALAGFEESLPSFAHIRAGGIDVRTTGGGAEAGEAAVPAPEFTAAQRNKLKEIFHGHSPFRKLNVTGLEEIVVGFVDTFRREARLLQLITPVKSYSEYTYTHATNVTVLSLFQAEALGIKGELLHEIGMAALLHDIGKMFIPKEILDKNGALDDREWAEIRKHTLYGAWYLAKIDGLTRLAPIVTMEHHLRYDCQGYPKLTAAHRSQHICSQVVAIADFFDALRSRRPYKKEWEIKEILALLKKNAGKEFNPDLVDNFSRMMYLALNEA